MFAIGDVRSGSVKRVAAAVGEGAAVVAQIHGCLAALAEQTAGLQKGAAMSCSHVKLIAPVTPSADGCEECLKQGLDWVHLRICRVCGHVGCCDQSIGRHATGHFHATGHPVMEAYYEPEGWGWCYVDEVLIDLEGDVTEHPPGWRW